MYTDLKTKGGGGGVLLKFLFAHDLARRGQSASYSIQIKGLKVLIKQICEM